MIDRIAELTDHDDSIAGEEQMDALIGIVSEPASLTGTAEELIIASLMATPPALLERFAHSAALPRLNEWLTAAVAADAHGAREKSVADVSAARAALPHGRTRLAGGVARRGAAAAAPRAVRRAPRRARRRRCYVTS